MISFAPPQTVEMLSMPGLALNEPFCMNILLPKSLKIEVCVRTKNGEVRASSQTVSRIKEETENMTAQLASRNHVNIPQSVV